MSLPKPISVDRLDETVDAGGAAKAPGIDTINERAQGDLRQDHTLPEDVVERANARARRSSPGEASRFHLRDWPFAPDDEELADMTTREREVFLSVEVHGFSPAELADRTGAEASTIRTLLANARATREGRR